MPRNRRLKKLRLMFKERVDKISAPSRGALRVISPKAPWSFVAEQTLGSAVQALLDSLDSGDPASHLDPGHFRQFCPKRSANSKSEIEAPHPGLPPSLRNFQRTNHSPICGQYLCKHRAKISFAHLQGLPPDPYAACGRKLRR